MTTVTDTPTTTTTTSGTTATPDLTGFLMAHRAMRQEFGLLADVAAWLDAHPGEPVRRRLFEQQVAMVLETLHHHHTAEDDTIWPWLRQRVPAARAELDLLEAEHEQIDPVLQRAGDLDVPLAFRADALRELHRLVNAHLDREERVAVPLIPVHVSVPEWDALAQRALSETGRRRMPTVFGWLASASTPEQRRTALSAQPRIVRILFRRVWWPAYTRHLDGLYGSPVADRLRAGDPA